MSEPIAIVGIAAELPSGTTTDVNLDYEGFNKFLRQGSESYERIPLDRFDIDAWKGSQPARVIIERGSFLKDIEAFDYVEFGIKPMDARAMPVSTRKLLELSFLSLLDAGIDYRTQNIGCFMSGIVHDALSLSDIDEYEPRGSFGGIPAQMANRVSYHLDLLGPSVPTDTACSSSLTAMHLAIQAIRCGDCDAAVVGGCQINQRLLDFIQYSQAGVLSASDGKCKPFDASADGFSRGEGAVVMIIKRLSAALKDQDKIYATILGTGINSTGCAAPAYAPVAAAQIDSMLRAYSMAGRSPGEVDFCELHATGTASGDPTEANWIGAAFKRQSTDQNKDILIGSVKGNIGHLEITSFLSSLCKICGIFETGVIPPNVNFSAPNPKIHWEEYNLKLPLEPTPIPCRSKNGKPLVSISSSGIGGATGHAVIEGPPPKAIHPHSDTIVPVLIVVGGLSPRSTTAVGGSVSALLREHPDAAANLSVLYGRRSRQMIWRTFAIVDPTNMEKIRFSQPLISPRTKPPVGFVFSGQGPQHINMGRQLFRDYPAFRASLVELDERYCEIVGSSLIKETGLFDLSVPTSTLPETWPIELTLPAICMVQIAIFDLLRSLGISKPDFVMGHSAGETAVMYASGATSKFVALEIAIARGQSLSLTERAGGTMAALSCGISQANGLLREISVGPKDDIDIACHNSEDSVTIAGKSELIDRMVEVAKSHGIQAQKLRTAVAVHSRMMELCKVDYGSRMAAIFNKAGKQLMPTTTVFSTVTGEKLIDGFDQHYLWTNTRHPVLFTEALRSVRSAYTLEPTFVEIGAHPVLSPYLAAAFPDSVIVSTMRRTKNMTEHFERNALLQAIGSFVAAGHNAVNFSALNGGVSHEVPFTVPAYPFSRKIVPSMSQIMGQDTMMHERRGPLNHARLRINSETHPDMAEHVMKGEPILPATAYVESALEFGARMLWNVNFRSFLSLSSETPAPVAVTSDGLHWAVKTPATGTKPERVHADGYLSTEGGHAPGKNVDLESVIRRSQRVNVEGFYADLRHFAEYGPGFQLVKGCWRSTDEFLVEVDSRRDRPASYQYIVDPAVLDACIHVMVHPLITGSMDKNTYYLPSGFKRFFLFDSLKENGFPAVVFAFGSKARWAPDSLTYDVMVVDSLGQPLCQFVEFEVAMHTVDPDVSTRYSLELESQGSVPISDIALSVVTSSPEVVLGPTDVFFSYSKGYEHVFQKRYDDIDFRTVKTIWIFTEVGMDGGAALGLSRSLRREIPSCRVRLVLFQQLPSLNDARLVSYRLIKHSISDDELIVGHDGQCYAYRLQPVAGASNTAPTPFNPEEPWVLVKGSLSGQYAIQRTFLPHLNFNDVFVTVDCVQRDAWVTKAWGFVGRLPSGSSVLGISTNAVSGVIAVPRTSVIPWGGFIGNKSQAAGYTVALHVGRSLVEKVPPRSPRTALITHVDTPLGFLLVAFFKQEKYDVTSLNSDTKLSAILCAPTTSFAVLASGSTDDHLVSAMSSLSSNAFFWERDLVDLVQRNPFDLARTLGNGTIPASFAESDFGVPVAQLIQDSINAVTLRGPLFSSEKAYLLLGGVGSLGLRMASWMYSHGARHIILTSRSGRETLVRTKNYHALRILNYLKSLPDLYLSIEASDASDVWALKSLVSKSSLPIAGCFILTAVLEDRPFTTTTPSQKSFERVYSAKTGVLESVEKAMQVVDLDFLVCFTSISGLFGSAAQTNYAAANTALEEMTRKYDNAFCFVAPAIVDSAIAFADADSKTSRNTNINHITEWGMSTRDICMYLEDGLRKLQDGPFWIYVPPFNFSLVKKHIGVSNMFAHLVTANESDEAAEELQSDDIHAAVKDAILKLLDIDHEDFAPEVPLTGFGLDSLLASKLSFILRRFAPITQLQLLADLTFEDIMSRIEAVAKEESAPAVVNEKDFFDWEEVMKSGPNVVQLVEGEGRPLFLLHGPAGTIEAFDTMRRTFTSPLYGIQCTNETPYSDLATLAKYYYEKIKEVQPNGPYRLGGFCGSSLLLFVLSEVFQINGDVVANACMIDHFPTLYASPIWELDSTTAMGCCVSDELTQKGFNWIMSLYAKETNPSEKRVGDELAKAKDGPDYVRPHMYKQYQNTMTFIGAQAGFLSERFVEQGKEFNPTAVKEKLIEWLSSTFRFPVTLYLASAGMRNLFFAKEKEEWDDLGAKASRMNVTVEVIEAGHFDILSNPDLMKTLQKNAAIPLVNGNGHAHNE